MKKIKMNDEKLVERDEIKPKTIHIKEKKPTLKELQSMVGGLIQVIQLKEKQIIIDEEGKLKGKIFNKEATELWDSTYDIIVGDAVVLSDKALLD